MPKRKSLSASNSLLGLFEYHEEGCHSNVWGDISGTKKSKPDDGKQGAEGASKKSTPCSSPRYNYSQMYSNVFETMKRLQQEHEQREDEVLVEQVEGLTF